MPGKLAWAAVAMLVAAPGVCAAEADPDAVVRELLRRSRLLRDVDFQVPLELWRQYVRATLGEKDEAPRAPVAAIAEEGVYHLKVAADRKVRLAVTLRLHVFDPAGCRNLPVLDAGRAWEAVTLNGRPAKLVTAAGWMRFTPDRAGAYVLKAEGSLPAAARGAALRLPVARTARTLVRFDSPGAWELSVRGGRRTLRGSADRGTHGQVAVAPRARLVLSYRPPVETREHAPQYKLRGAVVWNLRAGAQQITARLTVAIIGGRTDRIDLLLPAGADRVRVTGPDVREFQRTGSGAAVFLRGRVREQTRLTLAFELPAGRGGARRLEALGVQGGSWSGGQLVVANEAGGSEILPGTLAGLREVALQDITDEAAAMLPAAPALAYEITGRRFSADVEVLDLGRYALRESIVDLAHYEVALLADGTMLCRARYEVRNRHRQFLRLRVPAGAKVLLARVNERSRPLTPLAGEEGAYLLPLMRSRASVMGLVSFPVEVVLLARTSALTARGELPLPLPEVDLPIAYAWCEAYVPAAMKIRRWRGPFREVSRYSSETAAASLAYGKGELAVGYRPEDRLKPGTGRPGEPGRPEKPAAGWALGGGALRREDASIALGRNYYRSGQDAYARGDYANAAEALRNVVKYSPKSPEAANAEKLLGNIKLVQGKLELRSKAEQAAGRKVQREIQAANEKLLVRQRELLEKGFKLDRSGRAKEARAQFEAADALSQQLVDRGEKWTGQHAIMRGARAKLAEVRRREQAQAGKLREEVKQLQEQKRYVEALKAAGELRLFAEAEGEADEKLGEQIEELALKAAKEKMSQKRTQTLTLRKQLSPVTGALQPAEKPKTVTRTYDVRDLVLTPPTLHEDADRAVQPRPEDARKKAQELARKIHSALGRDRRAGEAVDTGVAGVRERGGRLVVEGTAEGQKAVAGLLAQLRVVRGPQVQEGARIAAQRARGKVKAPDAWKKALADARADTEDELSDLPVRTGEDLERFIRRNYDWQLEAGKKDGGGARRPTTRPTTRPAAPTVTAGDLARRLSFNLGQKVPVGSVNLSVSAEAARALGVRFVMGANDVVYGVIDEAQFRTLRQLEARRARRIAGDVRWQETIVGTDALLANDMVANVRFADDKGNTLDILDNTIRLSHEKYVLIDRSGFLTAVRSGAMQHWTAEPSSIRFEEAPDQIEVPPVGRLVKFEKTLVRPADRLVLRASYQWKGNHR